MESIQQQTDSDADTQKVMPRVFVGIPTGPPKKYALGYMCAALQTLDYGNVEIHFAVTRFKDGWRDENGFAECLFALTKALDIPCQIHYTTITAEEAKTSFCCILKNLQLLRGLFLDGCCEYFLLLGGDNPPNRDTIKRLLALDCDVATALLYQRGDRMRGTSVPGHPMVWHPAWTLAELKKYDLHPEIMDEFRTAFEDSNLLFPLACRPDWRRKRVLEGVVSGSGCMLIRREVFVRVGFNLPLSGYHSEDIHFFVKCLARGYSVKADAKFHAPHLAPDGKVY